MSHIPVEDYRRIYQHPIGKLWPPLAIDFDAEYEGEPADYLEIGIIRFVSKRLRNVIEGFDVAIEFVPVEATYLKNQLPDYYVANLMESVECLDDENGDYEYWEDSRDVCECERLVLDESSASGHDLFWVRRIANVACASERFQRAVRESAITGVGFRDCDRIDIINEWH